MFMGRAASAKGGGAGKSEGWLPGLGEVTFLRGGKGEGEGEAGKPHTLPYP